MTILNYIKSSVGKLIEFKGVESVRYGISQWTGAHIIEITPSEVVISDDFLTIETSIVTEFEDLFPMEELIFISNADIITLSESLYCLSNKITESIKAVSESIIWTPFYNVRLINPIYPQYFNDECHGGRLQLAA